MAKPKLRFPEFTDEWEEKQFDNIATISGGYAFDSKKMISTPAKYQIVKMGNLYQGNLDLDRTPSFIEDATEKELVYLIQENDIGITLTGTVNKHDYGYSYRFGNEKNLLLNQRLGLIRAKQSMNAVFLSSIVKGKNFLTQFYNISTGGTGNQTNVSTKEIEKIRVSIPILKEQEKIADFLSSVDDVIQIQEEKIFLLEEQRKGIMQKLFNHEVRFKADDGSEYPEWEEKSFDEVFNIIQNNTFSRDCLNDDTGEVLNIHYGDVLIKYGAFIDVSKEEVPHINDDIQLNKFDEKSFLRSGDIIIADTAEDMTVGKATEICGAIGKKILSGLHTIPCRPKIVFAPKYLGYYINSEKYHNQLMPLIQGIKVSSISKGNISKTVIAYPCMDEQQKIADCLSAYDEAVQIKKDKLGIWKEITKGLLQQMFV